MLGLNRSLGDAGTADLPASSDANNEQADRLSEFANKLARRFEQTGSMRDLNVAIELSRIALRMAPRGGLDLIAKVVNLGTWLDCRFEQTGSLADLNEGLHLLTQAAGMLPENHPGQYVVLANLGTSFSNRFERSGSVEDLDRAIAATSKAVDAAPVGDTDRLSALNNLGNRLGRRFHVTGSMDDLDEAIKAMKMVVDAVPREHPDRAGMLSNYGNRLGQRFRRTGSVSDLDLAIKVLQTAVDDGPSSNPAQARMLNNLGGLYGLRFQAARSAEDLNRAIELSTRAVNCLPAGHPDVALWSATLGSLVELRGEGSGQSNGLDRSIEIAKRAADLIPEGHAHQALMMHGLGSSLVRRHMATMAPSDFDEALECFMSSWKSPSASPDTRIRSAILAFAMLYSGGHLEKSNRLLHDAVHLLPSVSPRWLRHLDKQHMLQEFGSLAPLAASTALTAGEDAYDALRLLELGRGVISGMLMDIRGDLSELRDHHRALADEFTAIRDELDGIQTDAASDHGPGSWKLQERRRRADQRLTDLTKSIRTQPGFGSFLLPPSKEELMAAADPDPIVVINVGIHRSDAFLIEHRRIRVLELPHLIHTEAGERAREFRLSSPSLFSALEWLWDVVARPCLDALGFQKPISDDNWPRVWWVPTGPLSQAPIHAAGRYGPASTSTVLDRVMSSYASSVKALIFGRKYHRSRSANPPSDKALIVAMQDTPGLRQNRVLQSVASEAAMLRELCPSLQLQPVSPKPCKDDVLQQLQDCRIFHFAGHGRSDATEPSRSGLLLEDWQTEPLMVGDLRDYNLERNPPFLAYLSACSTVANETKTLVDEGIHLVSAFQLAGFRHVVGTLWEVLDKHCVDVAKMLYETIRDEGMSDVAVCLGLHRAVRSLRDGRAGEKQGVRKAFTSDGGATDEFSTARKGVPNPYWIPYVHFGI